LRELGLCKRSSQAKGMVMTITYTIGDSLYINLTNRCRNDCNFCIRNLGDSVGGGDSLWLEREPSKEEVLTDILRMNLSQVREIVYCGYGEPTERLGDLLWICRQLKQVEAPPIRLNTNGHADLIAGCDTAPNFEGLVDTISISLNAAGAQEYYEMCRPVFGIGTYDAVLEFAVNVKKYVPHVILSIVGGTTDADACRRVADELGIPLRVR